MVPRRQYVWPNNKFNPQKKAWHADTLAKVNADNLYGYASAYAYRAFNLDGAPANADNYTKYVLDSAQWAAINIRDSILSGEEAYRMVTTSAGATLPRMDEQDTRMLAEAAGTIDPLFVGKTAPSNLGIIDSQDDILFTREDYFYINDSTVMGGYPFLDAFEGDSLALDTDGDGMPDLYETEMGLNALAPEDGAMPSEQGYTHLENYLNGVANGSIDKTRYETEPYTSQQPDAPTELESIRQTNHNAMSNTRYDLQGRPLQNPLPKQIYIENGQSKMQQ